MRKILTITVIFSLFLFHGCTSRPSEVGLFLNMKAGWKILPSAEWDGMSGGWLFKQAISPEAVPTATPGARILVNRVSIDPSAMDFATVTDHSAAKKKWWTKDLDTKIVAHFVDDGVYEIPTTELSEGVYAIKLSAGFVGRAWFFRLLPTEEAVRAAEDTAEQEAARLEAILEMPQVQWAGESVSSDGTRWPMQIRISPADPAAKRISGEVEWPTLSSVNKIEGEVFGNTFVFKETGYIKKGEASLGCTYTLKPASEKALSGRYKCDNGHTGSTTLASK